MTSLVTAFLLRAHRGRAEAQALLGERYAGIVGSDRYVGYKWLPQAQRQVCWSQLLRDFAAFVDRGGESARIGQALLGVSTKILRRYAQVRDGTLSRVAFQAAIAPLQANAAERALRRAVLWRKRSFGTQSDAASLAVERLLTVVTTLRQQRRDVLDYLAQACQAAALGQPAPSLLPMPRHAPLPIALPAPAA